MNRDITRRVFACVAAALVITACSQDTQPVTPKASPTGEQYMRSMSDTLARSKAFTFETSERMQGMAPDAEKLVLTFTRKVTVRRPNALFFELHGTGDTALEIATYYDGRTVTVSQSTTKVWAQTKVPDNLDGMLDDVARRFGLPVPIGDVVYSSPYDAFIGKTTKGGVVGQETIDGIACAKLDYADDFVEVRLWIPASGQPLPRRLEIVYKKVAGLPVARVDFKNWKVEDQVADTTFAFQPPQGYRKVEFRDFVAGMASAAASSGSKAASSATPGAKPAH